MSLFFQGKEVERRIYFFFLLVSFGLWPPFPLSNWGQTRVCWLSWTRKGSRLIFRRACNTKPTRTVGQKYKGERFSFFSLFFLTRALAATHNSLHFFGLSRLILNSLLSGLLAFTTFFLILRKRKKGKSGCCSAPCELGKEGGWFWASALGRLLAFLNANSILFRLRKKCHVEKHV